MTLPEPVEDPGGGALIDGLIGEGVTGGGPPYDRVFRIVSWAFLMATALIVAASGQFTTQLPGIVVAIAIAGGVVLAIHDVAGPRMLAVVRGFLQAAAALTFAAALMLLTGGYASPFAFTFPLIVGGASLVISTGSTVVLALATAVTYLASATAGSGSPTT